MGLASLWLSPTTAASAAAVDLQVVWLAQAVSWVVVVLLM
jgi:hypothetical protein